MDTNNLVRTMTEKARAVQAEVRTISGLDEAFQYAADITIKQGGATVAAAGWNADDRGRLKDRCDAAGVTLLNNPLRPHVGNFHTSITPVDLAIAETGSLVLASLPEDLRIATMLAETHVAVLPAASIRPDSESVREELEAWLGPDAPCFAAFITGASRTADIERILAIGVHGPQQLHILILNEEESK